MSDLRRQFSRWLSQQVIVTAAAAVCAAATITTAPVAAQVAVRAERLYTMAGQPIDDGLVLIKEGKIAAIGKAGDTKNHQVIHILREGVAPAGVRIPLSAATASFAMAMPRSRSSLLIGRGEYQPVTQSLRQAAAARACKE